MAVDGTGLLVRCNRAAARTGKPLTADDGTPTGTLMMFIGSLARKLREIRPDYLVIAWDGPHSRLWRQKICPEYKANRPDQWDGSPGFRLVSEFCQAASILQLTVPGFEADDVLASVQRRIAETAPAAWLTIVSDDADLLQLLGDEMTAVRGLSFDEPLTGPDVERIYGVLPWWLPAARALAGDASDNIPGLPGVGPFIAAQWIRDGGLVWPLPEHLLPDPAWRAQVEAWRSVMELIRPPHRPEDEPAVGMKYFDLSERGEWHCEDPDPVRIFLEKYQLRQLSERLLHGRLW
jgi:5'-3' exonuclease